MTELTFDQEVELAQELFEHVRNDGREFRQMFRAEPYDPESAVAVGIMDEETADKRADALVAVAISLQAKQIVFMSDVWYRVVPKPKPAAEKMMRQTTMPEDGIMPSEDPERKEALIVVVFKPTGFEIATRPYEMVDDKVQWGEKLGDNEFLSNTFPRVQAALEIVARIRERRSS